MVTSSTAAMTGQISPTSSSVRFMEYFATLPDPRVERTKRHLLVDILGISICAVVCGAEGWTAIETYGQAKQAWLRQFFELPNGIPSDDTFRRVWSRLSPTCFQERFVRWVQAISRQTRGQVVAIDGKTLRHSYDRSTDRAAIHMISAWAQANRLILGQLKTEAKSNEITAIPELLKVLALEGCIVTIDAMGCQTEIAAQIIDQGAEYVLALKGNQSTVHQQVAKFFESPSPLTPTPTARHDSPQTRNVPSVCAAVETIDGEHGRIEIRRYRQVADLRWLPERSRWKGLQSVGMVETERHLGERITVERRYYLSSLPPGIERFAEAVRGHWGIENQVHWVLDVTFQEDDSRIRNGHGPENFAVLRHLVYNLLRKEPSPRSLKMKRFRASLDENYLTQILCYPDI